MLDGAGGLTVGAGACLSSDRFVTCAHVVNRALGRSAFEPRHPGPTTVSIGFAGSAPGTHSTARLTHWIPPRGEEDSSRPEGARRWKGDLALLEFTEIPPADLIPLPWREMEELQEVRAHFGNGDQEHIAYGKVRSCHGGFGYLHGDPTGPSIRPGYSGGPVWSLKHAAAVGLVVAAVSSTEAPFSPQQSMRLSWTFTWQAMRAELIRAGAEDLLPPARDETAPVTLDPVYEEICQLLEQTLSEERQLGRCAVQFAKRCALPHPDDGSVPRIEELVEILLSVPRALPAMAEVLAPTYADAASSLRRLALCSPALSRHLLSATEKEALLHTLGSLPDDVRSRIPAATRNALPGHHLLETLVDNRAPLGSEHFTAYTRQWVAELEKYHGDGQPKSGNAPRVPALLRAVEFVAALCPPDAKAELQRWTAKLADLLGIDGATLQERRGDAEQWAGTSAPAAPRLLVELTGGTGLERTRRYDVRVWSDSGDGHLRPASSAVGGLQAPPEIVRMLRGQLDRLAIATAGEWPTIELVVEYEDLEIDLDAMGSPEPPPLPPIVVGTRYPIVLRCPSIRRLTDSHGVWHRRWRALGKHPALLLDRDHDDPDRVTGMLDEDLDASLVVIHAPRETRTEIAVWCLAGGVPVVLWDRGDHDTRNEALFSIDPPVKAFDLPQAVQKYRAKARHSPDIHRARPVLLWDDPGRPLPEPPHLADPMERTESR
ncbi:trypsin-like peptidase domain-containing protein [Streptomyces sp. NPDC058989]|uniref:VMAP-C domain-containing protein n=1 Tax=Streptomyces sp. NPDC058989 TaxID=3346686 RepID=UPI0036800BEC